MWQQVEQVQQSHPLHDFTTEHEFISPILIVEAFASNDFFENYHVGYLRPIYNDGVIKGTKSYSHKIRLQKQFLNFFELPYKFKLEVTFKVWLPNLTLTFYEPEVADTISLTEIQGLIVEQRTNLAYLQQQLDRLKQQINRSNNNQ